MNGFDTRFELFGSQIGNNDEKINSFGNLPSLPSPPEVVGPKYKMSTAMFTCIGVNNSKMSYRMEIADEDEARKFLKHKSRMIW